jgi:branched-chain amino acid transport system ATP-binding protein
LRVAEGEATAVLGPNGAGKTTLFRALVGLVRPRRGSVRFEGRSLEGLRPHQVVRQGIAYVAAERELFPQLTVLENLELGAYARPDGLRERLAAVFGLTPLLWRG